MDVWTLNWSAKMIGNRIYLKAHQGEMALDLELSPRKPKIFHGEQGLEHKGTKPRTVIILLLLHRPRFKGDYPDLPFTAAH